MAASGEWDMVQQVLRLTRLGDARVQWEAACHYPRAQPIDYRPTQHIPINEAEVAVDAYCYMILLYNDI